MGDQFAVGRGLDRKIQLTSETDRSHHPQLVLREPRLRVTHRADDAALQILLAVDIVDDGLRLRIVEQTVDRKISTPSVFNSV